MIYGIEKLLVIYEMNFTESLIEYHKLFDYNSYKAFKKALYLSENINNLDIEHLFMGIYYTISDTINSLFSEKNALDLFREIEKDIFEREINTSNNYFDSLLKIFYQAKILAEYNNNLVSPIFLLVPLLIGKNNVSSKIKKLGFNISEIIETLEKEFNFDSKILFVFEKKDFIPFTARDKEVKYILESLCSCFSSNIIITGKHGVGKTRLINELELIIRDSPNLPERIKQAEIKTINSMNHKKDLFLEALKKQKTTIFFIDGLSYLNENNFREMEEKIFSPGQKLHIISTTGKKEFNILKDQFPQVISQFNVIELHETSKGDTEFILKKAKDYLESFHKIVIPDEIIDFIISLADKYMRKNGFPGKALSILDRACVKAIISGKNILGKENIEDTITVINAEL